MLVGEGELKYFHEQISQFKSQELLIQKAWIRLTNAGSKPLLLKGWAAAQFYDPPWTRFFSDVDLMVSNAECARVQDLLKTENLSFIDLHCGPRGLDSLDFDDLYCNSKEVLCGEVLIRIPRAEDHLRILATHWLFDGGAYKHRLLDINNLISHRSADFDWSRCLDSVGTKRRRWTEVVIGLTARYFDLDLSDTPVSDASERIPNWVIKTVEREWKSEVKLTPIHLAVNSPKKLLQQIRKRFPPNPIQATVELEGGFDKYPRAFYQIANIFTRIGPSIPRVFQTSSRMLYNLVRSKRG